MCRMSVKCEWSLQNISTIFSAAACCTPGQEMSISSVLYSSPFMRTSFSHILDCDSQWFLNHLAILSVPQRCIIKARVQLPVSLLAAIATRTLSLMWRKCSRCVCCTASWRCRDTGIMCMWIISEFWNKPLSAIQIHTAERHNHIVSTELVLLENVIMKKRMGIISQHLFMYCICLMWKKTSVNCQIENIERIQYKIFLFFESCLTARTSYDQYKHI